MVYTWIFLIVFGCSTLLNTIFEKIKTIIAYVICIALFVLGIASLIIDKNWILLIIISLGLGLSVFLFFAIFACMESGFRNKFPLDYLMHLNTEIDYLSSLGYQIDKYIEPGSEHLGVIMTKDEAPNIIILLNAPLNDTAFSVDIFSSDAPKIIKAHYNTKDANEDKIQPPKTPSPIEVTELGIVTDVKALHLLKA